MTGPASALLLPTSCYQLASCVSHFLRDGYEITILSLGSSEGWESLLTTQSPERRLADAPVDAPVPMHTLSGLQTKSNWSWGGRVLGREGEVERKGQGEQNKLCACMECSHNKKVIKFNFILLFIFFTFPKYEYWACISEMLFKGVDKALVLSVTSNIFSTYFLKFLGNHLLIKRNTYPWI